MSISVSKYSFLIYSLAGISAAMAYSCSPPEGSGSDTTKGGDGDQTISFGDGDGTVDPGGTPNDDPNAKLPPTPNCADGVLDDDEACDDGNLDFGDGCYGNCRGVERGFICRTPEAGGAQVCIPFAKCGDGVTAFPEQCDDGGRESGDGCSNNCKLEIGFKCAGSPSTCSPTTCGDGVVEGAEMCEPSLTEGCTAQCQFAPTCGDTGPCTSACGDGLVLGEECDDGNNLEGDGCSPDCKVEPGYMCPAVQGQCQTDDSGQCIQKVPVIYRDFSNSHPEFGADDTGCDTKGLALGAVKDNLENGKPVPTGAVVCTSTVNSEWYQDTSKSTRFNGTITLYQNEDGTYVNRFGPNGERFVHPNGFVEGKWCGTGGSNCDQCTLAAGEQCFDPCPVGGYACTGSWKEFNGTPFFFPVDNIPGAKDDGGSIAEVSDEKGIYGGNGLVESELKLTGSGPKHNFSFTSEIAYWFAFESSTKATFNFVGDDDVWVFVNGKLALDLGARHAALEGSFSIDGSKPSFGMTPGNVYQIKVFHAERQATGSTFKLTLSGFNTSRSDCTATCGDGIIGFGEECDDGAENGMGYNRCSAECTLGDYCGDGKVSEGEQCDDADPNKPANCSGCRIVVVR